MGEEHPVGPVFCSLCVSPRGKRCPTASLEKELVCSLSLYFSIPHPPCCLQKSAPAMSPSVQIGKDSSDSLSFLAVVIVGFLYQVG